MKCKDCNWFVADYSQTPSAWKGHCYLNPPVPIYYHAKVMFERPEVKLESFCSHFKEIS